MNIVPTIATFTVNRSCNFRCKWCYGRGTHFDGEQLLTMNLAMRLLEIIRTMGIKRIIVIGGEPTLWKHLVDFNARCRELNIKTSMVTNAYRFGDDDYWEQYINCPNDKVEASLKAFNSSSGTELAGVQDFEVLKNGIRRATESFDSVVSFVCNSFIANDLVLLARTAHECGAKKIIISPCTPTFSEGKVDTVGMLPLGDLVKKIVSQYEEINALFAGKLVFTIKTPFCIWPRGFIEKLKERNQLQTTCQFQHRSGIIFDPRGQVLACNRMAGFPMGMIDVDYSDATSLVELFNNAAVVASYNHINSYPSELCIGCPQESLCRGGCPLMWSVYNAKESILGWHKKGGE